MSTVPSRVESSERPPPPLPEYLGVSTVVNGAIQLALALAVAGLAASRADAHVLSPAALAAVVVVAAAAGVLVGWPVGLYAGALDLLRRRTRLTATPRPVDEGDPFAVQPLWRATLGWTAAAAMWAAAGAALVAVALDGHRARLLVVFVALAGIAGVASVSLDALARRRGAEAAARLQDMGVAPYPLRRRAWLHFALPIAVGQFAVNAGFAWLLFHDHTVGDRFAPKALTDSEALADIGLLILIVCAFFAYVARQWGEVDAMLRRVTLDDPDVQAVPAKAPIGRSGFVYLGLLAFVVLGAIAAAVLPSEPSLGAVMVVRGLFAATLAGGERNGREAQAEDHQGDADRLHAGTSESRPLALTAPRT